MARVHTPNHTKATMVPPIRTCTVDLIRDVNPTIHGPVTPETLGNAALALLTRKE